MKVPSIKSLADVVGGLSLECQLLVGCTLHDTSGLPATLERLGARLDWQHFLALADAQRLAPYAYTRLSPLADVVPNEPLLRLKDAYEQNLFRNMLLRSELNKVLELYRQEGIDCAVLKGSALVGRVFLDSAVRFMSDIDLLVRDEDIDRAWDLVVGLGYQPKGSEHGQQKMKAGHHHYPGLMSGNGALLFEIHRHLFSASAGGLTLDVSELWQRSESAEHLGPTAKVLGPEDMVTHLCVHFFLDRRKSNRHALGQLLDITETLHVYEGRLNWDAMVRNADRSGLKGPLFVALAASKTVLDAPVSDEVLAAMAPGDYDEHSLLAFLRLRVLREDEWIRPDIEGYVRNVRTRRSRRRAVVRPIRRILSKLGRNVTYIDERLRKRKSAQQQARWRPEDTAVQEWQNAIIGRELARRRESESAS